MKKVIVSLLSSVIWLFATVCWCFVFCMDFYRAAEVSVKIIHALIALLSLASAVFHFVAYKRQKDSVNR